jgi:hypothetical protein
MAHLHQLGNHLYALGARGSPRSRLSRSSLLLLKASSQAAGQQTPQGSTEALPARLQARQAIWEAGDMGNQTAA